MKLQKIPQQKFSVFSKHSVADVMVNLTNNEKSLHITKPFKANEKIISFGAGTIQDFPTYLTVQIALKKHITLQPEYLQYINHSCNPNVFFDTETFELIALKNLEIGDELTFFYPSTEWQMTQSFNCFCASANCLQRINGAAFISKEILSTYRLTSFIKEMLLNKL